MRIGIAMATLLVITSALFAQGMSSDAVVAEVNGEKITVGDVLFEIGRLSPDAQQRIVSDPNGKTEIVNSIVRKKLLVAEAKNMGLDTLPVVKAAIERSANDIYAQMLLNIIQQQNSTVTDEEIQDFYNQNDTLFDMPTRYHIAQLIFTDEKTAADVHKKLSKKKLSWDDAVSQYPGGADNKSGDAGWIFANQIVPSAKEAIKKLSPGEFTEPIKVGNLFYIVKLIESEPPRKRTLEEVKDGISQWLGQKKGQQAITDYQNRLYMQAKISIDNKVLNSINIGGQPAQSGQR